MLKKMVKFAEKNGSLIRIIMKKEGIIIRKIVN
jgi:hypothetical protein